MPSELLNVVPPTTLANREIEAATPMSIHSLIGFQTTLAIQFAQ
jgi:hypothetical protein